MKALRAVVIGGLFGFAGLLALSAALGQGANTDKPAVSAPAKAPEEPSKVVASASTVAAETRMLPCAA